VRCAQRAVSSNSGRRDATDVGIEILRLAPDGGDGLADFVIKPVLHVLTGCTAVGKTEWAVRWAESHGAEIVSCDSLLFYRGMNIGTAKPTPAERARVPHHLIDILGVTERMDITDYVTRVREALEDMVKRGRNVLVAGGSGFYLKAFFAPVADAVAVAAGVRAEVAALPAKEALARLRALNPGGLGMLDTANPRRVTRALERCLASGRTLTELAADFARQPPPFADWRVELTRIDRPPEELERRIGTRVDAMLAAGLVGEVRTLLAAGLKDNPSASRAIGYRETIACLEGGLPESRLAAEIARATRALVKKQRTWFRTQLPAHRVVTGGALRDADELFAS
jgi:tRNA dimethylallyltransferase